MLKLQILSKEIFIHYVEPDAGPNNGGYISRIGPGDSFYSMTYEDLLSLGDGEHNVEVNVRMQCKYPNPNVKNPDNNTAWYCFMYDCGAITHMELIHMLNPINPGVGISCRAKKS